MSSTHPRGRHPPIQAEERMAMVGGGAESFSAIHPAGSVTVPPPKKSGASFSFAPLSPRPLPT